MYIILRGTMPCTIISNYMPQSDRPNEETTAAYATLQEIIDQRRNKGPLYIHSRRLSRKASIPYVRNRARNHWKTHYAPKQKTW